MPALGVPHPVPVIDVTAIVETAAIVQPVAGDNGVGVVHEGNGLAPAMLIEIAGGACIVPRVRHVAAMRETADMPRPIAMSGKVGDQRLKAASKAAGNGDLPRRSRHCANAAGRLPARGIAVVAVFSARAAPRFGPVMRAVSVLIMRVMMTMSGLRRDCDEQKKHSR